jgi:molybdenum cofactor sulfurtransferase
VCIFHLYVLDVILATNHVLVVCNDALLIFVLRILQHFNTTSKDYTVVFTSNCSAALRLVADAFQLRTSSQTVTSDDNHTLNRETATQLVGFAERRFETTSATAIENTCDGMVHSNCTDDTTGLCRLCQHWKINRHHSVFAYLDDNHTSVLGMRSVLSDRGATICCLAPDDIEYCVKKNTVGTKQYCCHYLTTTCSDSQLAERKHLIQDGNTVFDSRWCQTNSLFSFPAQSNFNGHRYPLKWTSLSGCMTSCAECQVNNHWFLLLDAAALLTSGTVDLQRWKPDFVTLSFYKMFGFPTGLGRYPG